MTTEEKLDPNPVATDALDMAAAVQQLRDRMADAIAARTEVPEAVVELWKRPDPHQERSEGPA